MPDHTPLRGPLSGLNVIELGELVAAPYCGKLLSDLGADVVKVEPPGEGDPARRRGPFPDGAPHPERSALFLYLNTGKRSLTLDINCVAGRELFSALVAKADILVEDRAPGELEPSYAELRTINPGLIVTSITPFGQTGPHSGYRCHHLNLYHAGGQTQFWSPPEGQDLPPPLGACHLGECDGGLTAAVATLAAVIGRRLTDRGTHIDISKQEAMMCLERVDIGQAANATAPAPRRSMVGGLLEARDGWLMTTAVQQHQWEGLVRAMGDPEWAAEEWCKDEETRTRNRDRIQPHLEAWAATLDRDEIYHRCQTEAAPVGPVRTVAEVRNWSQAGARDYFRTIDHPEAGPLSYPSTAYRFSKTPWAGGRAPLLGEHTEEVLLDTLGLSRGDIERMSSEGVI